jgi:hypothetical protein
VLLHKGSAFNTFKAVVDGSYRDALQFVIIVEFALVELE